MKIRLTNSLTTELIDKANPAKNRDKTRPIFDLINFFSSKESCYIYLTVVTVGDRNGAPLLVYQINVSTVVLEKINDYLYTKPDTKLVDRALGGIGLQNSSEGFEYQVWEIYYESGKIKIKGLTNNVVYELLEISYVTELSYTYLRFYDSFIQDFSTLPLMDCRSPRLVYDDYRVMQTNTSDIICAYINKITLQLCYRISRDRFTVEYPLADVQENARLIRVGMTKGLRLQFKMSLI